METNNKNIQWITNTKGIAMLFVITGHIVGGVVTSTIFLFHMPFFFILSGMLYSNKNTFRKYFSHKALKFFIPYIVFTLIFISFEFIKLIDTGNFSLVSMRDITYKNIYGGPLLSGWQSVFWFIPVFFISQQIFSFLISKTSRISQYVVITSMLILAYLDSYFFRVSTPFDTAVCLFAVPLIWFGYMLRNKIANFNSLLCISILLFSVLTNYLYPSTLKLDMKYSFFGFPIVGIIISLCATSLIIKISKTTYSCNDLISVFGERSMLIMYIHQYIIISIIGNSIKTPEFKVAITIAICYLFAKGIKCYEASNFEKNKIILTLIKKAF
ncbi:hypothetical protein DT73_22945 [Mangrovibacter sp. MFB070]|uniref:acyltransferase family protein n=1 Tax=Mangrovibacter sp. MFB070 TaxID=1224318 RepID=UPI0004D7A99F|nr:acyltransferase family protein [Mangrovibacter sp. MFB070]KEA50591.1 hypothetical protein DT73_22945 [Mangrovibacter sp. MFB070]